MSELCTFPACTLAAARSKVSQPIKLSSYAFIITWLHAIMQAFCFKFFFFPGGIFTSSPGDNRLCSFEPCHTVWACTALIRQAVRPAAGIVGIGRSVRVLWLFNEITPLVIINFR